jgi:hypothetical protein
MSFKFYRNGKEITPPKRVTWYFEIKPDARFQSVPEKIEINANFWRRKLGLPMDAKIAFVPNDEYTMDLPIAQITKEDDCDTTTDTATTDVASDTIHDGSIAESDIPQVAEDPVNTDEPKPRRKASKLSAMPEQLADSDPTVTE